MPRQYDHLEPIPDVSDVALMMRDARRGDGVKINVSLVVEEYLRDLRTVYDLVHSGGSLAGVRFSIPDLWHVTKGDAADLPKGDADRLLEAWYFGHRLARQFLTASQHVTHHDYPATLYRYDQPED